MIHAFLLTHVLLGFSLPARFDSPSPHKSTSPVHTHDSDPSTKRAADLSVPLRGASLHDTATQTTAELGGLAHSRDTHVLNESILHLINSVNTDTQLFTKALVECAHAAEWRSSLLLLQAMRGRDVEISESHYTHVIRACSRAGEWEVAESVLHRARERGVKLNRFAYSHVIDACGVAKESEAAMRVYALGLQDGAIRHWREDEPFALDLHGFSVHTAECAVRYVLRCELGNYIEQDLKIVTGQGRHSVGEPVLFNRIQQLLAEELQPPLPFSLERRLECTSRDCWLKVNAGCIVIAMQDLFQWLLETRPFESYVFNIPSSTVER